LINGMRSWLSTREIFQSAAVCKAWRDVSEIPKKIYISLEEGYNSPPPHVDLSKTNSLTLWQYENADEALDLLHRCASNISELNFVESEHHSVATERIPFMPKVTKLTVIEPRTPGILHSILSQTPNVMELYLEDEENAFPCLDFGLIPKLQTLRIYGEIESLSNLESVNLQKIIIMDENNLEAASEILEAYPAADVQINLHASEYTIDHELAKIRNNPKYAFKLSFLYIEPFLWLRIRFNSTEALFDGLTINDSCWCQRTVQRMKALLPKIRSMRRKIGFVKQMSESKKKEFITLLAATHEFSLQELSNLCLGT